MAARQTLADRVILLPNLPATPHQRRVVLAVAVLQLVAFGVAAPVRPRRATQSGEEFAPSHGTTNPP